MTTGTAAGTAYRDTIVDLPGMPGKSSNYGYRVYGERDLEPSAVERATSASAKRTTVAVGVGALVAASVAASFQPVWCSIAVMMLGSLWCSARVRNACGAIVWSLARQAVISRLVSEIQSRERNKHEFVVGPVESDGHRAYLSLNRGAVFVTSWSSAALLREWRVADLLEVSVHRERKVGAAGQPAQENHWLRILVADTSAPLARIGFGQCAKSADEWRARLLAAAACSRRANPMIVERHVIREHVKEEAVQKCRYCGAFTRLGVDACRNCGAPGS
jgi:hypothetical protein